MYFTRKSCRPTENTHIGDRLSCPSLIERVQPESSVMFCRGSKSAERITRKSLKKKTDRKALPHESDSFPGKGATGKKGVFVCASAMNMEVELMLKAFFT